ncbi:SigE family RNA polymerase sigma factor [Cellulosimicrobium cellulans]|uniref:SigE family RNA polymerase sigma factor n=1 Tax=Cellulosimicrobium cellulans TaxID=1710 RepID=UPI00364A173C
MNAIALSADDEPDESPPPETLLPVVRVVTSHEQEFSDFMASAAPRLARTAWLLCGDEHLADELVQLALTRTYLHWRTARERDPYAYARRTLANLRVDTWRRRRREVLVAPPDLPETASDARADQHAERDVLVRALATLTARQRRIVVLRHLVGLSEREVADDLGVSVGTVKSTASRGLAQLRAILGGADPADARGGAPGLARAPRHPSTDQTDRRQP